LTDVDLSTGTKRTPQQEAKSNATQDGQQHNAAIRRRKHKHRRKNLIYVKTTYLDRKKRRKKDVEG